MNPELLQVICCPATRQSLRLAGDSELSRLNDREGGVEAALVTEDGRMAYPIRDGLPVLLVSEGMELDG